MTPAQFVAKWSAATLSERAASHEHFIDLCRMLNQPTPAEIDSSGAEYTFEKGVTTSGAASRGSAGERGFADVWWRGKFAWEYKRKDKYRDLSDAYRQLCQYREALENPPLLVVCDIARTEIHTNFTGTAKEVHTINLADLPEPHSLDLLRRVFTDPHSFKPATTAAAVTEEVARKFAALAQSLRSFGHDPQVAAHFLMKCMFCLFAEDVNLLPERLFTRLLETTRKDPEKLTERLTVLFDRMRTGGDFGVEPIAYFNGGLFDEAPALRLTAADIKVLLEAADRDWGSVEPAIFGTLFERSLDPNTRAQIGAHYTSRDDIMLIVEPVVMAPLRREWEEVKDKVEKQLSRRRKVKTRKGQAEKAIVDLLQGFVHRLSTVRILDPACGSGNFLYVAIQQLLDLEKEVITFAARPDIALGLFPQVRPTQLYGIEINPYAAELAQVVIWIGYLQWMRDNGFIVPSNPILEPLQTIECRDAILDLSDPKLPVPAKWPDADFIIGNPPFLGSKLFRQQGLEDDYIKAMFNCYDLPNTSDLCCYWFEQGRKQIEQHPHVRAGLLATQGIRGGDNREVLKRIKKTGDIFMAWSDREWILDGAAVHVSIVGFGGVAALGQHLNGKAVVAINSDLSHGIDLTKVSCILDSSDPIWSVGTQKGGDFDLDWTSARALLSQPNPSGKTSSQVIRPWPSGVDLTKRDRGKWVIYFPPHFDVQSASLYAAPFEHIRKYVKPFRDKVRRQAYREKYWQHQEPRVGLDRKLDALNRFILTPMVTKYRLFTWRTSPALPDKQVTVFARSDDYFFGVLHSSIHELWARRMGTQLREAESGFRYTPTTCFETFPLPWPPGKEPADDPIQKRISDAAKALNEQRERWLNPPEWIEPIAAAVDAEDDFADVPAEARPLIRHSAIMARAAKDPKLKKRTLTNLYNQRPTWLKLAHEALDRAVLASYAAIDPEGGWQEDWATVWTDSGAGQPLPEDHPLVDQRKQIDQQVLANLLRLNLARAKR